MSRVGKAMRVLKRGAILLERPFSRIEDIVQKRIEANSKG